MRIRRTSRVPELRGRLSWLIRGGAATRDGGVLNGENPGEKAGKLTVEQAETRPTRYGLEARGPWRLGGNIGPVLGAGLASEFKYLDLPW